ncbi:hypothetical protein ACR2R6_02215 [Methylocaldum gracile subsp. desertum]|uniref:hypothetical protein n=1 Tax=Methylocaldum sp. GT1BW TaxID=3438964 RepID=UPI003DA147D7
MNHTELLALNGRLEAAIAAYGRLRVLSEARAMQCKKAQAARQGLHGEAREAANPAYREAQAVAGEAYTRFAAAESNLGTIVRREAELLADDPAALGEWQSLVGL